MIVWIARLRGIGLAIAIVIASAAPASAAKISSKASVQPKVEGRTLTWWNQYYVRALANHQIAGIRVPMALRRIQLTAEGLLPDTPLVEYLRWRRSVNPSQFDANHTSLGPLISRDNIIRNTPQPEPSPQPGHTTPPPSVPEPSMALVGLMMCVAGAVVRLRMRHRDAQDGRVAC
jgi:hypothetical protein